MRKQMAIGQALIILYGFVAGHIWNMDETAFTWAIGSQYAFVPTDARRVEGEQSDTKMRLTVVITGGSEGDVPHCLLF